MAERKTMGEWFRANWPAIVMPIISAVIALGVAWGSFQRDNANMLNRISALETAKVELKLEVKDLKQANKSLEDQIDERSDEIEDLVISEGRELERQIIRLSGTVGAIGNRLAFIDGIGAARPGSGTPMRSLDFDLLLPPSSGDVE